MTGRSILWEDTNGCAKQYMCALAIYLMTVFSSSYSIIMDRAVNSPGLVKRVVDGINATYKGCLKVKCNLLVN